MCVMHVNICVSVMLIYSEPISQPEKQDLHDWQRFSIYCQANITENMSSCVFRKRLKLPSYITKLTQLVPWFGHYVTIFFPGTRGIPMTEKIISKALMVIEFSIDLKLCSLSKIKQVMGQTGNSKYTIFFPPRVIFGSCLHLDGWT